jgi:hypothetical protein
MPASKWLKPGLRRSASTSLASCSSCAVSSRRWRAIAADRVSALVAARVYDLLDVIASKRYGQNMISAKRATIYFEPKVHKALRLKAADLDRSISDIVNEAVRFSLAEDAEDLADIEKRKNEPNLDFERVVRELRARGKL